MTHLPTGITVNCQAMQTPADNQRIALELLRTRLVEAATSTARDEVAQTRKTQRGSGDRSEKVRTYNFVRRDVTDHALKQTFHLDDVLDGDLQELVDMHIALQEETDAFRILDELVEGAEG